MVTTNQPRQRLSQVRATVLRRVEEGGLLLWTAISGGIWLWAFHLLFLLIFTREACYDHTWIWAMHATTFLTGLATIAAGWICVEMVRAYDDDEDAGTVGGRTRFLGIMGFLVNTIALALIVLEGAFVALLDPCG